MQYFEKFFHRNNYISGKKEPPPGKNVEYLAYRERIESHTKRGMRFDTTSTESRFYTLAGAGIETDSGDSACSTEAVIGSTG